VLIAAPLTGVGRRSECGREPSQPAILGPQTELVAQRRSRENRNSIASGNAVNVCGIDLLNRQGS
jgi:hypothetical protein